MSNLTKVYTFGANITGIGIDSSDNLYVGLEDAQLMKSTNGGTSWTSIVSGYTFMTVLQSPNGKLYGIATKYVGYTPDAQVVVSEDGGITWTAIFQGADLIRSLAIAPDSTVYFIVGMGYPTVKKYVPGTGVTTDVTPAGVDTWNVVTVDLSGSVFVAADGGSVCKSTNSGSSWTILLAAGTAHWYVLGKDGSNNIYALPYDGYIKKSEDHGDTWLTLMSAGSNVWGTFAAKSNGNIYVAPRMNGYVLESTDGGTTFSQVGTTALAFNGAVVTSDDVVFIASAGSTDLYSVPLPPTATPQMSLLSGVYSGSASVVLTSTTPSATIYYTTDGSDPTTSSSVYTSTLTISSTQTLKAIAQAPAHSVSAVATSSYVIVSNTQCTAPSIKFSPLNGTSTTVQLGTLTPGATIYYTTDGNNPTTSSSVYTAAFSVESTQTIKAFATKTNYTDSAVSSDTYTLGTSKRKYTELFNYTLSETSQPYAYGSGGATLEGGTVRISYEGWINKYTTTGDTKYAGNYALKFFVDMRNASAGRLFSVLVYSNTSDFVPAVQRTATGVKFGWIKYNWYVESVTTTAYSTAIDGDFNGTECAENGLYTVVYMKKPIDSSSSQIAMKVISPTGKSFQTGWATVTDSYQINQIGFLNNGSQEGCAIGPISVEDTLTADEIEYLRTTTICSVPVLSPTAGSFDGAVTVEMSQGTSGATLHYTTDGLIPTSASATYSTPLFYTSGVRTIMALGTHPNYEDSALDTGVYTVVFGGPILTTENWEPGCSWEINGAKTFSSGSIVLDAASNGITSMRLFNENPNAATSGFLRSKDYRCIEMTVTTTGRFRFGAHPAGIPELSSNQRLIEFEYNGSALSFFIRGTALAGFDGSVSIPSNTAKLRMAFSKTDFARIAVLTTNGTVVADTGLLNVGYNGTRNDWVYTHNTANFNDSASTSLAAYYWQPGLRQPGSYGTTPTLISMEGVTTIAPYKVLTNAQLSAATEFVTLGTTSSAIPTPADPVISVVEYANGTRKVTITPDENSFVYATINEGASIVDKYDILKHPQAMASPKKAGSSWAADRGEALTFYMNDPGTIRAVCYNGIISNMVTQYVGPTTAVPIPEISPRNGVIYSGSSYPVKMYCANPSATIRYTIDGSEPTSSSPAYTGTVFLRDTTLLRAKAFNGAAESVTKNALFWQYAKDTYDYYYDPNTYSYVARTDSPTYGKVICCPVPKLHDADAWNYTGNATFNAVDKKITVNDPSGYGIDLRTDIFPHYGDFISSVGFRVNGNFRLKRPGIDRHIAWVGDACGTINTIGDTPTGSMGGATYAYVSLHQERGIIYAAKIVGYDATDTQVASINMDVAGLGDTPVQGGLYFSGEGLPSYEISNIQIVLHRDNFAWENIYSAPQGSLKSYPFTIPGKAFLSVPTGNDFAGGPLTITKENSGDTIASWVAVARGEGAPFESVTTSDSISPLTGTNETARVQITTLCINGNFATASSVVGHGHRPNTTLGCWNVESNSPFIELLDNSTLAQIVETMPSGMLRHIHSGTVQPANIESPTLSGVASRTYEQREFTYPYDTFDTGNVWYRFLVGTDPSAWYDLVWTCGWNTDRATVAEAAFAVDMENNKVSARLYEAWRRNSSPSVYIQMFNTNTWTKTTGSKPKHISPSDYPVWNCGRKVDGGGNLLIRTVIRPSSDMTTIWLDTGWVDLGPAPTTLPRPRITCRIRHTDEPQAENTTYGQFVRGWTGLTEVQVDNCFAHGVPSPSSAPTVSQGTESNGMVPFTWDPVQNVGAAALYMKAGSSTLQSRTSNFIQGSNSYDEGVLTVDMATLGGVTYVSTVLDAARVTITTLPSNDEIYNALYQNYPNPLGSTFNEYFPQILDAARITITTLPSNDAILAAAKIQLHRTISMPSVSTVHAVNLLEPVLKSNYYGANVYAYDGFSDESVVNLTHDTLDYININSSIPHHVYLQFDKSIQLPVVPAQTTTEKTYWKIVFSDGYEYPVNALISDDIERVLSPGTYTVKFVRCGSDGVTRGLGETTPAAFTVSNNMTLSTAVPSLVQLNTATTFAASVSGGTTPKYLWTFSDGVTANTASVSRTFTKSGRYTWEVAVIDATGDAARASGRFVVIFPADTVPTGDLSRSEETRVS